MARIAHAAFITLLVATSLRGQTWERELAENALRPWAEEPPTYRGLAWATSEGIVAKKLPIKCESISMFGIPMRRCPTVNQLRLADVTIQDSLGFNSSGLAMVMGSFESENYDVVKRTFTDKYGPPVKVKHDVVQGESLLWSGKAVVIGLSKYDRSFTKGSFSIQTVAFYREAMKASEAQQRKAKDAL